MLEIKCPKHRSIARAVSHDTQTFSKLILNHYIEFVERNIRKKYVRLYLKKGEKNVFFQNYNCIKIEIDDGWPYGSFSKG